MVVCQMSITGQRMRLARKEAGLKQKTAARELRMEPSELSRIESGHPRARELRGSELVNAANLYNRSTDWLLGLSDSPRLRPDLAWRLAEIPPDLARYLIETPIYVLHEFLEQNQLLNLAKMERESEPRGTDALRYSVSKTQAHGSKPPSSVCLRSTPTRKGKPCRS